MDIQSQPKSTSFPEGPKQTSYPLANAITYPKASGPIAADPGKEGMKYGTWVQPKG